MQTVGIGVIGCGIGKWHLEGYDTDPRANVVAISGLEDRCHDLAREHDVPNVYTDYREMLARPDIQAVSIAVPNFLHVPIGLDAIAAGKHVLMEKPLARNTEEGEVLVRAAEEAGLVLGIIFNRRSRADMQALKSAIDRGALGEIYHARAYWNRRAGIPGLGSWFTNKDGAGGGPLIDLGVHVLDMALWLMDEPNVTRASAATYAKLGPQGIGNWSGNRFSVTTDMPYEVEDFATAFLRTARGSTLYLEASWAEFSSRTDEFGVHILGTKGGAELDVKDYATVGTLKLFSFEDGVQIDAVPRLPEKVASAGHAEVIHAFLDSILDGVPMVPDGRNGLERTALIDAIYRSAREDREVEVPSVMSLLEVGAA
ncbi:MAG: Gfo/Idh/MocA family oxidoreductase [Thermomicrobiales bacterium]|nr:Gfo/Idh/MocA family oxidoreductase [Thermomicrobiales bacterium]